MTTTDSFLEANSKKGSQPLRGLLIFLSLTLRASEPQFMLILRLENAEAKKGEPNPFIVGQANYGKFLDVMSQCMDARFRAAKNRPSKRRTTAPLPSRLGLGVSEPRMFPSFHTGSS